LRSGMYSANEFANLVQNLPGIRFDPILISAGIQQYIEGVRELTVRYVGSDALRDNPKNSDHDLATANEGGLHVKIQNEWVV
jgi:hypothetical protein